MCVNSVVVNQFPSLLNELEPKNLTNLLLPYLLLQMARDHARAVLALDKKNVFRSQHRKNNQCDNKFLDLQLKNNNFPDSSAEMLDSGPIGIQQQNPKNRPKKIYNKSSLVSCILDTTLLSPCSSKIFATNNILASSLQRSQRISTSGKWDADSLALIYK
jgi:hypothetical protein